MLTDLFLRWQIPVILSSLISTWTVTGVCFVFFQSREEKVPLEWMLRIGIMHHLLLRIQERVSQR